jgi:hypothetical protein
MRKDGPIKWMFFETEAGDGRAHCWRHGRPVGGCQLTVKGSVVLTGFGTALVSSDPAQPEPAVRVAAPNVKGDDPSAAELRPLITWLWTLARKLVLAGTVTFWRHRFCPCGVPVPKL